MFYYSIFIPVNIFYSLYKERIQSPHPVTSAIVLSNYIDGNESSLSVFKSSVVVYSWAAGLVPTSGCGGNS